ncbi:pilus assembly protein TadG-related protein [Demequina sp. NBRC 110051]|uniref:pilus assembly protein TadG-related protein n=1 Tax=Demequina sp. NBRC 110051 TaxID=1570340 RepID=UPI00135670B4|nr:pilus assembly protein TadG-related protein [Demequina sp. NBRC 110051]
MTRTPGGTTTSRGTGARWRDDDGSMSVWALGWIVVIALAALVVASATQVHLERLRLVALADEVALSAADAVDGGAYYGTGGAVLALDDDAVRVHAATRLAADPARPWIGEVGLLEAGSDDGQSARIVLGRTVHLPWRIDALAPWSDGIRISATATARTS